MIATRNYTYDYQRERTGSTNDAGNNQRVGTFDFSYMLNSLKELSRLSGTAQASSLTPHAHANCNMTSESKGSTYAYDEEIVAVHRQYDPFGNLVASTGSLQQNYQWSSKETDASTGLVYYLYRFYNPTIGRWLSRDPIAERGGINLYDYVRNNPVDLIDPLGLNPGNWWPSGYGVQVSGSVDGGNMGLVPGGGGAAGVTGTAGSGLFTDSTTGQTTGGNFLSGGAFINVPGLKASTPPSGGCPGNNNTFGVGANAGVGPGVFVTNAGQVGDLNGPFCQWNLNLGIVNFSLALSASSDGNITYIASMSGPNLGLSASSYPTYTQSTQPAGPIRP